MVSNVNLKREIRSRIERAAPELPEAKALCARLALEYGWRSQTIMQIVYDMDNSDNGFIKLTDGIISPRKTEVDEG